MPAEPHSPPAPSPDADPAAKNELPFEVKMAFVAQAFWAAVMGITLAVFLPKFYTDTILLPAGMLAAAVALARAFDAVTDPLMGFISDHTSTRWGRRRPWIALGVLGNSVVFYLLLVPPEGTGAGMVWWYAPCFIVSFLFVTMVSVPRGALAVELTINPRERTSLYGMIALFVALGLIVGAILPEFIKGWGVSGSRDVMQTIAVLCVVGYLLTNLWFLQGVPERKDFLKRGTNPFVPGVRRAMRSKPFRVMFASHVVTGIPIAIPATLMPYYVEYVMKSEEPEQWTGFLLLTYLVAGFLALPFWVGLSRKIGRLKVWLIVSFIGVTGGIAWFFIGPGDEYLALGLEVYVGMQASVWFFLGGAMHGDIVDYDELMTGKRREAQFAAYWTIIPKFALILGASIPLAIMQGVGYVPNQEQTPEVAMTIRVMFALVPAVLNAIGLSIMWWYPLSEKAHELIRAGIDEHARGKPATDPITGCQVLPSSERPVDENTSWRLDHFSRRELQASLDGGPGRVLRGVVSSVGAAAVLTAAGGWVAHAELSHVANKPGVLASLAVAVGGLSFALLLFHLLRVKPALRMQRDPVDRQTIQAHLDALANAKAPPARDPAAATG